MVEKYSAIKRIPSFDIDMSGTLKPASFLNYAQEAANIHADYLGVGFDAMHTTRKAWVLSKIHVIFHKLPKWRENINVQSWHKGANGYQYFRDFVVFDAEGKEKLISATTSWLVIDIDTRRLSKYAELAEDEGRCISEDVIAAQPPKVIMPKDVEPQLAMTHAVCYSDLDMNGHVNNVKYTEWSMNAIELEVTNNHRLKELVVNFNSEIKAGDVVEIYRHSTQQGEEVEYIIEGRVNGKGSFTAKLVF